jgi:hypothetical protein
MVAIENKIQRYDTYKNSGVAWLGKIPEHWECIRMKHLYKDFRQQVLTQAVTGKLTEEWRVGKELGEWEEKKLSEICLSITDGDHQSPPRSEIGIPFLVISNISKGHLDFESVTRFVPSSYYESLKETRVPRKGDLLYSVTGSFGIPILVKKENKFCFQRHIAILKPDLDLVSSEFLFYLLSSNNSMDQAKSVATGTAQLTVPLRGLRSFSFKIPSLQEQQEIVHRVESLFEKVTAIEQHYEQLKSQVDTLPQAILHKAFKGELVEQLDGDGSASELLEQIKNLNLKLNKKSKSKSKTTSKTTNKADVSSSAVENVSSITSNKSVTSALDLTPDNVSSIANDDVSASALENGLKISKGHEAGDGALGRVAESEVGYKKRNNKNN